MGYANVGAKAAFLHRMDGSANQNNTPEDIRNWASTDVLEWIGESTEIRDTIYPENANNMSYDYLYDHLPIAKQRLQMAGIRIAMYLNKVFEEANSTAGDFTQ